MINIGFYRICQFASQMKSLKMFKNDVGLSWSQLDGLRMAAVETAARTALNDGLPLLQLVLQQGPPITSRCFNQHCRFRGIDIRNTHPGRRVKTFEGQNH